MHSSHSIHSLLDAEFLTQTAECIESAGKLQLGVYSVKGMPISVPEGSRESGRFPESLAANSELACGMDWVVKHRKIWVADPAGPHRSMLYPLEINGECDGLVLGIPCEGTTNGDCAAHEKLLSMYGQLVAQILQREIESRDMATALMEKYEEVALVYTLSDALNISKKQEEAIRIIFESLIGAVEADLVFLSVPALDFELVSEPDLINPYRWRKLYEILMRRLKETQDSLVIDDIEDDPELSSYSDRLSHVAATLLDVDGAWGVLAFTRKNKRARMSMNDLKLLEAVGREASIFLTNKQLQEARTQLFDLTIFSLARLAESRDDETGAHLDRVSSYCLVLTKQLMESGLYPDEINDEFLKNIHRSSVLHDIGKVGIPDSILLKPGKLTPEEFEIMKTHTTIGGDTIRDIEKQLKWGENTFLTLGRQIAYNHHEKWDGSGYHRGLAGTDIPLAGRIMAVADVYDALTTKRCYKPAFSHEKAMTILKEDSGSHFDPVLIEAFLVLERNFDKIRERYQGPNEDDPASVPAEGAQLASSAPTGA